MWLAFLLVALVLWITYRLVKFWIVDPWRIHRDLWSQGIQGRYIPIVGDILHIRQSILAEDPFSYSIAMEAQFGDYYHSSFGPIARLSISDPSLINGVLKTNARAYHKSHLMQSILTVMLGTNNLIIAEDETHAQHRRLIAPAFQHQNVNSMISLMSEITSCLIRKWATATSASTTDNPLILDIHEEMARLTLDIVTGCVFGTEIISDEKVHETIYQCTTEALDLLEHRTFNMTGIIPIINRLPLNSKRRIDKCNRQINQIVRRIINERKKGLTKSACKGPDLLDLLLAVRDDDDKTSKFTDQEVYEEALTFVLAGHETTSTLMTWTLYNLANNTDVCRRLEAEIDSVLNDDEEITASTLSLLTYTESVLKESLRLHQPVPFLIRTAIKDNTLVANDGKQIHIKKGTDIVINLHILHHSKKHWREPLKFDPSRFDENQIDKLLLPFGAGPRSCIGQNFAMLEAKIMLALMVRRYRFELVPGQKIVPDIAITMRPKYGIWMRILPR